MEKRKVKLAVISDLHLGTFGCQAVEVLQYLRSIEPEILILNGDIIDVWQFKKNYFPPAHTLVLKEIMQMVANDVQVHYLVGNHDEVLRKFGNLNIGSFHLQNKVVLHLDDKKAWFFHGDVFDVSMRYAKWLARLGAIGYDILIYLNSIVNYWSIKFGKGRMSFSKTIKDRVKTAVKYINDFETTAAQLAIENGYAYVICGHIHQPAMRKVVTAQGSTLYLNSGDWIENLSAIEYHAGNWQIYRHQSSQHQAINLQTEAVDLPSANHLFQLIYQKELA